jgi:hypothetical protein
VAIRRRTVYRDIPTYFPGDTIKLRLKFQHEVHLTDMWANFEKQEEVSTLAHFRFTARLRSPSNLRQLDRVGAQMISESVLEALVGEGNPLPGVYELSEVHGLPSGEDRAEGNVLDFDVPEDVRFRISAPHIDGPPRVTHWELGWERQPQDSDMETDESVESA